MSLTYSAQQPGNTLPRTSAIVFIVLLHAMMFYAFNSGIGSFLVKQPPKDLVNVPLPPEQPLVKPIPVPLPPAVHLPQKVQDVVLPDAPLVVQEPEVVATDDIAVADLSAANDSVDQAPTTPRDAIAIIQRTDPAYPASSRRNGEHGTVLLEVHIDSLGHAIGIDIVRSSGFDALDSAAINAVRQWRFTPTTMGASVRVPITFKLNQQS